MQTGRLSDRLSGRLVGSLIGSNQATKIKRMHFFFELMQRMRRNDARGRFTATTCRQGAHFLEQLCSDGFASPVNRQGCSGYEDTPTFNLIP